MFRLNTNMGALAAANATARSSRAASTAIERLSTGLRINHAVDDPAGLGMSERIRSQLVGQRVATANISRAVALLQTADSALGQIGDVLVRLRELAMQSADATLASSDRLGISAEALGLISEIDRIANATQFNGISLLQSAGKVSSRTQLTFFIGDGTSSVGQTASLALKGVMFMATGLGSIGDTPMNITVSYFGAQTSSVVLVDSIDAGVDAITAIRGDVGSSQSRLETTLDNLIGAAANNENALSTIRDADFAQEATALTRAQLLVQAGTAMIAKASQLPQTALLLLL
jgi:flagellin